MARRTRSARVAFPPDPKDPAFKDWIYKFWATMTGAGRFLISQFSTVGLTANQVLATDTSNAAVVGKTVTVTTPIVVAHSNTAITLTHANSGVTAGIYGNATTVGQVTFNATGHASTGANVAIAIPSTQVTDFTEAAQDATGAMVVGTGNVPLTYADATPALSAELSSTGVTAGIYGNATAMPQLTLDVKGRITLAANVPANIPVSQLVDGGANQVVRMTVDGANAAWVDLVAGTGITITQNAGNITISLT